MIRIVVVHLKALRVRISTVYWSQSRLQTGLTLIPDFWTGSHTFLLGSCDVTVKITRPIWPPPDRWSFLTCKDQCLFKH